MLTVWLAGWTGIYMIPSILDQVFYLTLQQETPGGAALV